MEDLKNKLIDLLNEELYSLSIGHLFNEDRIAEMKDICRILVFLEYTDIEPNILENIINIYESYR